MSRFASVIKVIKSGHAGLIRGDGLDSSQYLIYLDNGIHQSCLYFLVVVFQYGRCIYVDQRRPTPQAIEESYARRGQSADTSHNESRC